MLPLLLAVVSFHTEFEGGSLGRVEGAAGQELTLDLADLVGEYNYRRGAHAVTAHTPVP